MLCLGVHKQKTGLGRCGVFQWLGGHRPGCGGVHAAAAPSACGRWAHLQACLAAGGTRAIHTEPFRGAGAPRGTSEKSVWGFLISGGGNEDAHEARLGRSADVSHHPSLDFSQLNQSRELRAVVTVH